jgi:hypothetical protein
MGEETQKIIAEQMKKLPNEVREAILSIDYEIKLQEIYKRQRLLIDQAQKLETETSLVLLGLEPISDYISNLEKNLNITPDKAQEVALDVDENIFKKVRTSLQKIDEDMLAADYFGTPEEEYSKEPPVTKFTNTNEAMLNRDQILKEIEDPSVTEGGEEVVKAEKETPTKTSTALEVRPAQELETLPGEGVKDITPSANLTTDILQAKMSSPTIISKQAVEVRPSARLPEIEKIKTYKGVDPYREPII